MTRFNFIRQIIKESKRAEIPRHSAALAFYAIYALAPLAILFVSLSGFLIDQKIAEEQLINYFQTKAGGKAVPFIETFLIGIKETKAHLFFSFVGIFIMIYGLSHFFNNLKKSFFVIFGVHFGSARTLGKTAINFLKSFSYSLLLVFFVLALIFLNTVVPIFLNLADGFLKLGISRVPFLDFASVFLVTFLTLSALYKLVSVGELSWKNSMIGAILATLLFSLLNIALALYFNLFNSAHSIYGTSASLIAFLLWIYSSSQILLLGALAGLLSKELKQIKNV